MIRLDRNESYWLLDDSLSEAVRALGIRDFSTYPDYGELKSALANYAGVAPEQLLLTPGSDVAIEHIARAYAGEGGEVLLPVPTFYGYETILNRVGTKVIPVCYKEENGRFIFPLQEVLEILQNNSPKILFLCHPNNPLGCSLSKEDVATLAEVLRGSNTILVSDEAYFEFSSGTTFLPYLSQLPNLIVIRTLSKSFALAGARVGYALAAPEVVQKIERCMLLWPIAHASVSVALSLLARATDVEKRRALVIRARDEFANALRARPDAIVYPSETNFILVRVPDAARMREAFLAKDIRVVLGESMTQLPDAKKLLHDTLRIAIPSPADLPNVLSAFTK